MPLPAGRESEYIEERDREMSKRHAESCTYIGCPVCKLYELDKLSYNGAVGVHSLSEKS